jgi:methylated-DNA-protein-cysteine methyltransferase-like protein
MANENFFERVMLSQERFLMESYILWRYCKALGTARSKNGRLGNECFTIGVMFQHRVVNRNGLLTGKFHFDGTNLMQLVRKRRDSSSRKSNYISKTFWEPESSFSISINGLLGKLASFILE